MSIEKKEKVIRRKISDLGVASYVNMFGYPVAGRDGRNVYFDIKESEIADFDRVCFEYHSSVCAKFDLHLMAIKKMANYVSPEPN